MNLLLSLNDEFLHALSFDGSMLQGTFLKISCFQLHSPMTMSALNLPLFMTSAKFHWSHNSFWPK